jgi:hypothetical protein
MRGASKKRVVVGIAAAVVLTGCAGVDRLTCGPGLMRMVEAELFFGRDIAGRGMVTDEDWRRFVDEEVTPRFPAGSSVGDVSGQYRDNAGGIVREPSKVLRLFISGTMADAAKLNAIRDAYKSRFAQESVLLVESPVCAEF